MDRGRTGSSAAKKAAGSALAGGQGPAKSRARSRAKRLAHSEEDRGRQVVRLLTMLRALENARRGLTAKQLLDAIGKDCVLRTVYRSIDHLRQAGFPIHDEEGVFRLAEGGALRSDPIRSDEVLALLLSEPFWQPYGHTGPAKVLAELHARLRATLAPPERAWLDSLSLRMRASVLAPTLLHEKAEILERIDEAIRVEQVVEITYSTPNKGVSLRNVEPHLLWLVPGKAYLGAYCHSAGEPRTFAIQRIADVRILDDTFERRPEFDAREYTQRGFGVYHGETFDFALRFTPAVAHLAHERAWHPTQRVEELADGGADLSFRSAGLPEVAAWVASFGGKVIALEPPALLDAVRALHQAGLANHAASR